MDDPGARHLSELSLDLLLLGDLGWRGARRANRHIRACEACRESFELLRSAAKHFEKSVRPRTEAHVVRLLIPPVPAVSGKRRRLWAPVLGTAALAAVAFVLVRSSTIMTGHVDDGVLAKGAPALTVFVRHRDRISVLRPGARVEPGDAIRFTADPNGSSYLLVASIDAAAHVTIYVSDGGKASAPVRPNDRFEDGASFILDETRGPERIFALFSRRPIDAVEVERALVRIGGMGSEEIRRTARLAVPADSQTSLLIEK
jgi:hypothetical protein